MHSGLRTVVVHSERPRIVWRPGKVRRVCGGDESGTDAGSDADEGGKRSLDSERIS